VRAHCRWVLPHALLLGCHWMHWPNAYCYLSFFALSANKAFYELWISQKNGPAAGKGKAVCAFYKIKGIPWFMKRKIKRACGNVFHRMVSKARKKKQTGLMHNTGGVFHYIIKLRKIFLSKQSQRKHGSMCQYHRA
jgi:hypothetical protein